MNDTDTITIQVVVNAQGQPVLKTLSTELTGLTSTIAKLNQATSSSIDQAVNAGVAQLRTASQVAMAAADEAIRASNMIQARIAQMQQTAMVAAENLRRISLVSSPAYAGLTPFMSGGGNAYMALAGLTAASPLPNSIAATLTSLQASRPVQMPSAALPYGYNPLGQAGNFSATPFSGLPPGFWQMFSMYSQQQASRMLPYSSIPMYGGGYSGAIVPSVMSGGFGGSSLIPYSAPAPTGIGWNPYTMPMPSAPHLGLPYGGAQNPYYGAAGYAGGGGSYGFVNLGPNAGGSGLGGPPPAGFGQAVPIGPQGGGGGGATSGTNFANLAQNMSLVNGAVNGLTQAMNELYSVILNLTRLGFQSLVSEVTAATAALVEISRSFIDINEKFQGLNTTLSAVFRSSDIADAFREQIMKITGTSPIPFQGIADWTRALAANPATSNQMMNQAMQGSLDDQKGFYQKAVTLLEQMMAYRPDRNVQQAVFSLQQALGGEMRSMIRIFGLPSNEIAALGGTTAAQMKSDPTQVLDTLEKVFNQLIPQSAISQYTRLPSVAMQNINEQAWQIPAVRIGDAGLMPHIEDLLQQVLHVFSSQVSGRQQNAQGQDIPGTSFFEEGMYPQRIAGAVNNMMDGIIKQSQSHIEDLLTHFGFGQQQMPNMTLTQRAIEAATEGLETFANKAPTVFGQILDFLAKIVPQIQKLVDLLVQLGGSYVSFAASNPGTAIAGAIAGKTALGIAPYAVGAAAQFGVNALGFYGAYQTAAQAAAQTGAAAPTMTGMAALGGAISPVINIAAASIAIASVAAIGYEAGKLLGGNQIAQGITDQNNAQLSAQSLAANRIQSDPAYARQVLGAITSYQQSQLSLNSFENSNYGPLAGLLHPDQFSQLSGASNTAYTAARNLNIPDSVLNNVKSLQTFYELSEATVKQVANGTFRSPQSQSVPFKAVMDSTPSAVTSIDEYARMLSEYGTSPDFQGLDAISSKLDAKASPLGSTPAQLTRVAQMGEDLSTYVNAVKGTLSELQKIPMPSQQTITAITLGESALSQFNNTGLTTTITGVEDIAEELTKFAQSGQVFQGSATAKQAISTFMTELQKVPGITASEIDQLGQQVTQSFAVLGANPKQVEQAKAAADNFLSSTLDILMGALQQQIQSIEAQMAQANPLTTIFPSNTSSGQIFRSGARIPTTPLRPTTIVDDAGFVGPNLNSTDPALQQLTQLKNTINTVQQTYSDMSKTLAAKPVGPAPEAHLDETVKAALTQIEGILSAADTISGSKGKLAQLQGNEFKDDITKLGDLNPQVQGAVNDLFKGVDLSQNSIQVTTQHLTDVITIADALSNKLTAQAASVGVNTPEGKELTTESLAFQKLGASAANQLTDITAQQNPASVFTSLLGEMRSTQANFVEMGQSIGQSLSQNLGTAFDAFVTGANHGKDAFKNFATSMISDLARIASEAAAKQLIGLLANIGGAALGSGIGNLQLATNSVPVATAVHATGGYISGGSGTRDDVPAMLMGGEYVVRKSAVDHYGADMLDQINSHSYKHYATGGLVTSGAELASAYGSANPNYNPGGVTTINIHNHGNDPSVDAEHKGADGKIDPKVSEAMARNQLAAFRQFIEQESRAGGMLRRN